MCPVCDIEFFDRDRGVRINTNRCRDFHRLRGDRPGIARSVPRERFRRGERVGTSRSNRNDPIVGFDQIAVAGQQERHP